MGKRQFKPGNMLYPVPAVMVSVADKEGNSNIFTVAWAGTVCTNPPMLTISVRPERHSYQMIKETGEFVVNLTTEELTFATDYCGVRSGRDTDKWKDTGLTKEPASKVSVPLIKESPVNLECKVVRVDELGSHHMFLAEVVAVDVDDAYFDEKDTFHLSKAKPMAYSHGRYYGLGEQLGTFGYSVRKNADKAVKKAGEKTSEKTVKKTGEKTMKKSVVKGQKTSISRKTGDKKKK
ncbi:MAG: flavin reductase family protein [Lachnospiraceae bacterium]|nr:flavin reductase family protein [Lachnospiraceae bacterium]